MEAIANITFAMGPSADVPAPTGYTRIDQDLNEKAGGKYVYLCYTTEDKNEDKPITGLFLLDDAYEQPPAEYYKCPLDLNQEAGGNYIFLCWTRSQTAGVPITDITFVTGKDTPAPAGYIKLDKDLNKNAGGKYIYLCYKRG